MRTRFKLQWLTLLSPEYSWDYPHGLERCLLAYAYLVRTANDFRVYGKSGPFDLLCKKPSCLNISTVDPILSRDDLRSRIQYAVLYGADRGAFKAWRKSAKVRVTDTVIVTGKHYLPYRSPKPFECERDIEAKFDALLKTTDVKLNRSFNKYHKRAVWIQKIVLHVYPWKPNFHFDLYYGYRREASSWNVTLAQSDKGKTPLDTLAEAIAMLKELTDPPAS